MIATAGRIADALDKLATEGSPAQIAARLELDCCVGVRCSTAECPVAEWLLVQTGLHVDVGGHTWFHDGIEGSLPPEVAEFIQGFDREVYPLLDHAKPA